MTQRNVETMARPERLNRLTDFASTSPLPLRWLSNKLNITIFDVSLVEIELFVDELIY